MRRLSKEEELGIGKAGRKVDMKEEYYVSVPCLEVEFICDGGGRITRCNTFIGSVLMRFVTETCGEGFR